MTSTQRTPSRADRELELVIGGMTCASCASRVERKLNKLDGVTASVNYATEKATITSSVSTEDLIATVRVLGINPDRKDTKGIQALGWMSEQLGQPPLGWHPPDGYPDIASAWASTTSTLAKWNIHMNLANQWWPKDLVHPPAARWLPSPLPTTHGGLVDGITAMLMLPPLPAAHRSAICTFLDKRPADPLQPGDAAMSWRLGYVVALLLDTPQAALR